MNGLHMNQSSVSNEYRRASRAFDAYVSRYGLGDERIRLKYEHSLAVSRLCGRLAEASGVGQDDVELARVCGLLHDIGRFEQVRRWGTFSDAASCSHAALGLEILEGAGAGGIFAFVRDAAWVPIVKAATALHSALRLPDNLDGRTGFFCRIVRDADKVDIMRVFAECSPEAVLGVPAADAANGRISEAAMAGFRERRCLTSADRSELLDGVVGVACFAFELEIPASPAILRESGNLEALLDHPLGLSDGFTDPDTRCKWVEIREAMRLWRVKE